MTSLCTNCINEKLCGKPVKYVINTHYHFDLLPMMLTSMQPS